MDKYTLSQYGWSVIIILILIVMISMATPFGNFVSTSAMSAATAFVNLTYDTLGIARPLKDASQYFKVDNYGALELRSLYDNDSTSCALLSIMSEAKVPNFDEGLRFILYMVVIDNNLADEPEGLYQTYKSYNLSKSQYDDKMIEAMSNECGLTDIIDAYKAEIPDKSISFEEFLLNMVYDGMVDENDASSPFKPRTHYMTKNELDTLVANFVVSALDGYSQEDRNKEFLSLLGLDNDSDYDLSNKEDFERFCEDSEQNPDMFKYFYDSAVTVYFHSEKTRFIDFANIQLETCELQVKLLNDLYNGKFDIRDNFLCSLFGSYIYSSMDTMDNVYKKGSIGLPSSFSIPEELDGKTITEIPYSLFQDHEEIITVGLPSSITKIGDYAFSNCTSLEKINLDKVTELGLNSFSHCSSLKEVKLAEGLTSVPNDCFAYSGLESVTLPNGLESIGYDAFSYISNPKFLSITIPASVNSMYHSFDGVSEKFIIKGVKGSFAETYAKQNGNIFVAV